MFIFVLGGFHLEGPMFIFVLGGFHLEGPMFIFVLGIFFSYYLSIKSNLVPNKIC